MITRTILTGLLAGTAGGAVLTALYLAMIQPMIFEAEVIELGAAAAAEGMTAARSLQTFVANVLTGVGFALLLAAGFVLRGKAVGARQGVIWGLAGFAAVALAPALGLPPELPGMTAAPLGERQLWWMLTVIATGSGIGLLVFAPHRALKIAAVVLLVAPHIVGAPHPADISGGAVPAELAARFAVVSLASMAAFWAVIGASCGYLADRLLDPTPGAVGTA